MSRHSRHATAVDRATGWVWTEISKIPSPDAPGRAKVPGVETMTRQAGAMITKGCPMRKSKTFTGRLLADMERKFFSSFLRGLTVVAVLATFASGCVTHRNRLTHNLEQPDKMKEVIVSMIPRGTPTSDVISRMEDEGFECEVLRNSRFRERRSWMGTGTVHDNLDYVNCKRTNSAGSLFMARIWAIAVVLDGDVSNGEVLVSHYVDGP